MSNAPYSEAVLRAAPPEVLFLPDIAIVLQIGRSTARRAVLRGQLGPYIRVGRRIAVLRTSFLDALAAREQAVPSPPLRCLPGQQEDNDAS
jgi:hypothetical protein